MKKLLRKIVELLFSNEIENAINELAINRIKAYPKEIVSNAVLHEISNILPNANDAVNLRKINPIHIMVHLSSEKRVIIYLKRLSITKEGKVLGIYIALKYKFDDGNDINSKTLFIPLRHIKFKTRNDYDNIDVDTYFWDYTSVLIPVKVRDFNYYTKGVRTLSSGYHQKFYKHLASDFLLKNIFPKYLPILVTSLLNEFKVNSLDEIILLTTHPIWQDEIRMSLKEWKHYFSDNFKISTCEKDLRTDKEIYHVVEITVDDKHFIGIDWSGEYYLFMRKVDYPYSQSHY